MKRIYQFLLLSAFCVFTSPANCQKNFEPVKTFYPALDAGGGMILSFLDYVEKGSAGRIYELEVMQDGEYYLGVTWSAPESASKSLDLKVDGEVAHRLPTRASGFENTRFGSDGKAIKLKLNRGKHTLDFFQKSDILPAIDNIILSKSSDDLGRGILPIENYIQNLKARRLATSYLAEKSKKKSMRYLNNPEGLYDYQVDISSSYTQYYQINLTAGSQVKFETKNSNCDPVLYLVNKANPSLGSWSNDDSNGTVESTINASITSTGVYILLVRARYSSSPGICNIYRNNVLTFSNCAVAGQSFGCAGRYLPSNYFTCHNTFDTWLFVGGLETAPIIAHNDDYGTSGGGDFNWQNASRVKGNFNQAENTAMVITPTFSSGQCDVYMNCGNGVSYPDQAGVFKADDNIQAAAENSNYNCLGWVSGKVTTNPTFRQFVYNPNEDLPPYSDYATSQLQTIDNFLGNYPIPRYQGAWSYTRDNNDQNNAVIALWGTSVQNFVTFTHLSIRSLNRVHPNGQPHGYDWESKSGDRNRVFHPKYAFQIPEVGTILHHYKVSQVGSPSRTAAPISLQESIDRGLSEIEDLTLTEQELGVLNDNLGKLDRATVSIFERLHQDWSTALTAAQTQNTLLGFETALPEYHRLRDWCVMNGEETPHLIINKINGGHDESRFLLYDVTKNRKKEIMHEISTDLIENHTSGSGKYVVTTPRSIAYRYIKKIIAENIKVVGRRMKALVLPNPVIDILEVDVETSEADLVDIYIGETTTGAQKLLRSAVQVQPGINKIKIRREEFTSQGNVLFIRCEGRKMSAVTKFLVK